MGQVIQKVAGRQHQVLPEAEHVQGKAALDLDLAERLAHAHGAVAVVWIDRIAGSRREDSLSAVHSNARRYFPSSTR